MAFEAFNDFLLHCHNLILGYCLYFIFGEGLRTLSVLGQLYTSGEIIRFFIHVEFIF